MPERPHVCVFCGSARGVRPAYADAGRRLGIALARADLGLVYGGGRVGIMGILADAALAAGGRVVGVIPKALATKELAHEGVTELHVVAGMHERKALMAERAAAFLTLAGGIGTYEEFFEILTWSALGLHRKPVGLLNVEGYFDPLLALLDHAVSERFTRAERLAGLVVSDNPETIVHDLLASVPPVFEPSWIARDET